MNTTLTPRQRAAQTAIQILAEQPVYLDTETTGLEKTDEIIEVGIIATGGQVLFESLVKPSRPIPVEATRIHHITNETVASAQAWPVVWSQARTHLIGHPVAIYNKDYDLRLIQQSFSRYRLPFRDQLQSFCIMKLYAEFFGEWDQMRSSYRYQSLDKAVLQCKLQILNNRHRAADDARMAREVLHFMAVYQGK